MVFGVPARASALTCVLPNTTFCILNCAPVNGAGIGAVAVAVAAVAVAVAVDVGGGEDARGPGAPPLDALLGLDGGADAKVAVAAVALVAAGVEMAGTIVLALVAVAWEAIAGAMPPVAAEVAIRVGIVGIENAAACGFSLDPEDLEGVDMFNSFVYYLID